MLDKPTVTSSDSNEEAALLPNEVEGSSAQRATLIEEHVAEDQVFEAYTSGDTEENDTRLTDTEVSAGGE